jgi:hypothetical protein
MSSRELTANAAAEDSVDRFSVVVAGLNQPEVG